MKVIRIAWLPAMLMIIFAALLVAPATGWMDRSQLCSVAAGVLHGESDPGADLSPMPIDLAGSTVASQPNDYAVQLGAVLASHPAPVLLRDFRAAAPIITALRGLEPKFDSQAGLHALILDCLPLDFETAIDRRYYSRSGIEAVPVTALDPSVFALADTEARRGETLDPQNAFFPTLRAVALFGVGRDGDAVEEAERAAHADRWDSYRGEAERSLIAARQAAHRDRSGLIYAKATYYQSQMSVGNETRHLARLLIGLAIDAEVHGDIARGYHLRHIVAHLGGTIRSTTASSIEEMNGPAIVARASTRPGGKMFANSAPTGDLYIATQDSRYIAYLDRIVHADEASWYLAERTAESEEQVIFVAATDGHRTTLPLARALLASAACQALLGAILFVLIAGATAALVCRLPHGRASATVVIPAAATIILFLGYRLFIAAGDWSTNAIYVGAGIETIGLANIQQYAAAQQSAFPAIFTTPEAKTPARPDPNEMARTTALIVMAATMLLLGLATLRCRRYGPKETTFLLWPEQLRAAAPPVATALTLAYTLMLYLSVAADMHLRETSMQAIEGEPAYWASLVGQTTPSRVPDRLTGTTGER